MAQLIDYKKYLTIKDAADRLSNTLGENIKEADILRLALDEHVTLSIYFVDNTMGAVMQLVSPDKAKKIENEHLFDEHTGELIDFYIGQHIKGKGVLEYDNSTQDNTTEMTGLYDFTFWGAERNEIQRKEQLLIGGPPLTGKNTCCIYVRAEDGTILTLLKSIEDDAERKGSLAYIKALEHKITEEKISSENAQKMRESGSILRNKFSRELAMKSYDKCFTPAREMPAGGVIVIRTSEFKKIEKEMRTLKTKDPEKLDPRERTSTYALVATLAIMAKLDLSDINKTERKIRYTGELSVEKYPTEAVTITKILEASYKRILPIKK